MESIVWHIYAVLVYMVLSVSYLVVKQIMQPDYTEPIDISISNEALLKKIESLLKENKELSDLEAGRLAIWVADRILKDKANEKKK